MAKGFCNSFTENCKRRPSERLDGLGLLHFVATRGTMTIKLILILKPLNWPLTIPRCKHGGVKKKEKKKKAGTDKAGACDANVYVHSDESLTGLATENTLDALGAQSIMSTR